MQRHLAVYRVLRVAGVALPAIAAYRWLETRERLGWPAPPATWERVHDRVSRGLHDLGVHLAGALLDLLNLGSNPQLVPAAQQGIGNGAGPAARFFAARDRVDRLLFAEATGHR
jgi:hypothetical protein